MSLDTPPLLSHKKAPLMNRKTAKKNTAKVLTTEAPTAIVGSKIFPWKVPLMTTTPMAGAAINEAIAKTAPR
jgi:hypothetical protein